MAKQRIRPMEWDHPRGRGPSVLLPSPAWQRPRVLIVEDEEDLRCLFGDELCRAGFDVLECADAREAVRTREWAHTMAGDSRSLDVVVTDLCLGEIDGLALLRRVVDARVDVSVVLVSGYGDTAVRVRAGELGADAFLDKPVSLPELRRLVARLATERQNRLRARKRADGAR